MKQDEFMKELGLSYADLEVLRSSLVKSGKMHEVAYRIICNMQRDGGFRMQFDSSHGRPALGSIMTMIIDNQLKQLKVANVGESINSQGHEYSVDLWRVG